MVTYHIKNMVCARCVKTVARLFQEAGVPGTRVELGKVTLETPLTGIQENALRDSLAAEGFEWLDDRRVQKVEEIKQAIIQLVQQGELDEMREKLSVYLSGRLNADYRYLSNLFSSLENTTIEQYFLLQKTEKVKEWLVYDEYPLSDIAFRLGYSSVAHLSAQFKKITGFTPSRFKKLKEHQRRPLDGI